MGGEWAESGEGRVEVTVPNEQAVEDLRLLIKLCYSDSFAYDEGQLLLFDARVRLGLLADGFEFVNALQQQLESLPLELDFEAAQTCLDDLPPALEAHSAMAAIRRQVVAVLVKGIEEREGNAAEEAAATAAADALAKCLGPVAGLFEGKEEGARIALRDDVKQLPLCVLKRLLVSEALQLQLENET